MRLLWMLLTITVTACATLEPKPDDDRIGLTPRKLSSGECGLFVWKADRAKTFILYADQKSAALYRNGSEVELSFASNTNSSTERVFLDPAGQTLSLSLLEPQSIEQIIRYKAGRLSSQDENGWETVIPVVGLFTCQPFVR